MPLWFALPLVSRPGQSHGFNLDSDERDEELTGKSRAGDDARERKDRSEEPQRPAWEKRAPSDDRRKRTEDSEPRLFIACDETQDPAEGTDKTGILISYKCLFVDSHLMQL